MITKATKNTSEFDALYGVLNVAQRRAVDAIEGPVMVIAGPGTGKTTILTLRIANIIKRTDTAPDSILALTFTESGAYAMRKKLTEIIGPAAYRVNIHTFHGFAEKVIQEYPDYFPRIIGSSIITDAEQIKIIEKIIQSPKIKILRPYGDPLYYVKSVLHEIHLLKRENITAADLLASIEVEEGHIGNKSQTGRVKELSKTDQEKQDKRDAKNRELAFVYKKYEEELATQKYYDFDDMLLELIHSMENESTFKLMLQETYQYILADEHQDANAAQNRILELLADFHDSPNLFIVGDDKQAIYRFQGASLENFLYFSKKYANATVIELEHNYRSHQGILDASHSIISHNPGIPDRAQTKLLSLQIGTKPIYIDEFPTSADEQEYVAVIIERLIKKGEKPEEIAVLYRENKEAKAISDSLRAHGIIHRIESDHNILGDIDSLKILILCRAIQEPSNNEYLGQVLVLEELGCDPADIRELFMLAMREKTSLHVLLKKAKQPAIRSAYERIVRWSREAQTIPFADFLQKIIQETKLITAIASAPNSLERMMSLQVLFDRVIKAAQSKKTFYLNDFIEYITIVSDHGIMTKRTFTEHTGGVRLMTAHRAKGLEFNHVFIVNAIDGIWGNRSKRNLFQIPIIEHARDTGRIEDERRLFYVAMTRARESVTISYARSNGEKETLRSQFISEIEPALISYEKPIVVSQSEVFSQLMKTPHATPATSILEPSFVRSLFFSQPLSVTHLNNFIECPWRYFFVNLIRVPQAPSKHQMYGTAIHATLRTVFETIKKGRTVAKKDVLDLFKFNLDKQPFSADDRVEALAKGKESLKGYYETNVATWSANILTEYAVKGIEFVSDNKKPLMLTGKIDKIEMQTDDRVSVIDYKTSKPKSRNDIEGKTRGSQGNYKRQLVFYKLLLDGEKKFNMISGEIDFVEPNERGFYKKELFEITPKEIEDLRGEIQDMITSVNDLTFVSTTCADKKCEYCALGKILRNDSEPAKN